mgnify:CR=1 FL=1
MNQKLTGLLTAAIVTGLIAGNVARAEEPTGDKSGDAKMAADKNSCKGQKDKNSCKGQQTKKKKKDKNSCKNGCGENKDKGDQKE